MPKKMRGRGLKRKGNSVSIVLLIMQPLGRTEGQSPGLLLKGCAAISGRSDFIIGTFQNKTLKTPVTVA